MKSDMLALVALILLAGGMAFHCSPPPEIQPEPEPEAAPEVCTDTTGAVIPCPEKPDPLSELKEGESIIMDGFGNIVAVAANPGALKAELVDSPQGLFLSVAAFHQPADLLALNVVYQGGESGIDAQVFRHYREIANPLDPLMFDTNHIPGVSKADVLSVWATRFERVGDDVMIFGGDK